MSKAIGDEEYLYRLMFMSQSIVMLIVDPLNGAILKANQAAKATYGFFGNTLRGMNIADISQLPESHIRLKKKAIFFSLIKRGSERRQIEKALQESEERYRVLFENSLDAVILTNRDGEILSANNAACRMFGVSEEQLVSLGQEEIFDVTDQRLAVALAEYARTGILRGELTLLRSGGSNFPGIVTSVIIRGSDGVESCCMIIRDITEREQAKRDLQESEKNLRTLMDAMPVGVCWFANSGRIEYVNRCFVERFGYTMADIPTFQDWLVRAYPDPSYRESHYSEWQLAAAEAGENSIQVAPREALIACKDGSVRHVIINSELTRNRTLAIFTDITEREFKNNEDLKAQKLGSLGVLAGGIAHDFNNILTGILGNISYAKMFLDEEHKSLMPLERAEKASLRAAELAAQLLTFARGGNPVKKPVSARQLVNESISLALRGANVKGVVTIPENLHAIEADEGQIRQVFNNIIINAVQAMPDGGILTVKAENVPMPAGNRLGLAAGEYITLSFTDEGYGIPYEDLKKIFDPYFTTNPGAAGLGLASALSIVSKHGGHIDVKTAAGRGTTFTVYLPSIGTTLVEQYDSIKPATTKTHSGGKILIMDDEEMIRELAAEMLEHLGYKVTTCVNGDEAVKLFTTAKDSGQPFLTAIMDLTIPGGMGGKEAAQLILANDPTARLIVSSGYSHDPVMAEYKSYGFCAAMAKPYKANEIEQILGTLPDP